MASVRFRFEACLGVSFLKYSIVVWKIETEKVAVVGFFVAVPDFLKEDSYVPSNVNRHIKVQIQDHSTVGSSFFYS
ncbi:hypothetical protein F8388_014103 [Cannabis sativa]|uniref:Uncharacterized protein n=1 Tax=Cannabis sativa TaxID=3483 RepID=A0A7J6GL51_CANSA|nr:hypothetical protein G4B88_006622 [Cannabis sativa]KAF4383603.1 hypothetical protein F8388_014103 [Cannabis sativa]